MDASGTQYAGIFGGMGTCSITINSGTVNAQGLCGIDGILTISGGIVTASGSSKAINNTVKNSIAGVGWTNTEGTEVQVLQQRLAALGYYNGAIDGDFGRVTDATVKAFQRANGLYVDGVVGPLTRQALGYTAPSSGKGTAPSSDVSLVIGSTGEAVLVYFVSLMSL